MQATATMTPAVGDYFWITVDLRRYYGRIEGCTPKGKKFILRFCTETPRINGHRHRELHVASESLIFNKKLNVPWQLVLKDKNSPAGQLEMFNNQAQAE